MVLDQTHVFFIIVGAMALVGFIRGWSREVVTCAVVLGAVLFLIAGGERMLARLLLGHLPGPLAKLAMSGGGLAIGLAALIGALMLGYWLGNQYGEEPSMYRHRLSGMLPGAAVGAALTYYLSEHLAAGTRLALNSPSDTQARTYVTLVYGLGFGVLLLLLGYTMIANRGKR
jgi:hypothetical protein